MLSIQWFWLHWNKAQVNCKQDFVNSQWLYLINNWKGSVNQIILGKPLHCITSSTGIAKVLSKSGYCISCNSVGLLGDCWKKLNFTRKKIFGGSIKGYPTPFHLDESNECQKIMIGFGTAHHTNTWNHDRTGRYAPHKLNNISAINLMKGLTDWEKTLMKVVKFVQQL